MVAVGQAVTSLIRLASRRLYQWWYPFAPSRKVVDGLVNIDKDDHEDAVAGWALTKKWCARAKAQFGYVHKRTPAGEAAVGAWLRKEMAGENVRVCDRLRVIPYAVACVFVPSDHDIIASKVHKVVAGRRRHVDVGSN